MTPTPHRVPLREQLDESVARERAKRAARVHAEPVRVGRILAAVVLLTLAACGSGAAARRSRASAGPTFLETDWNGRVALARLADGKIVRTVVTPSNRVVTLAAMHAPNGTLFLEQCVQPACGRTANVAFAPSWHDTATGKVFAGDDAAISPDGSRIAVVVIASDGTEYVRQYEVATGNVVVNFVAAAPNSNQGVAGLDWTPDGRSLIVDRRQDGLDGRPDLGGLYIVNRDARALPPRPAVPDPTDGTGTYFSSAAVLADGHVIAFQSTQPEHTGWPGALVDVNLATGAIRTLLGSATLVSVRACAGTIPATTKHPCDLAVDDGSIATHGNEALFNDHGQIWLYNGRTSRLIATANVITDPTW